MGFFNSTSNIIGQLASMAKAKRAQTAATSAQQQYANPNSLKGMVGMATQKAQGTSSLISKALGGQTKMAPSISPRQAYAQILNPKQKSIMNTNTMPQTPISPAALNNQSTIQGVFGQEQVPGSYNRSMSALPQITDSQPAQPPEDIQQAITPTYDLSNQ